MHLKLKYSSFILLFIIIILFVDSNFLGFFVLPDFLLKFMGSTNRLLVSLLVLFLAALLMINKNVSEQLFVDKYINRYLFIYLASVLLVFVFTLIKYDQQHWFATARWALQYLIVFLYFPLIVYMQKTNGIESVMNVIIAFILIADILYGIQAIVYNINGNIFLNEIINKENIRLGKLRIYIHPLNNIVYLYSIYKLFYEARGKSILKYLFVVTLIFFEMITMCMTRSTIAFYVVILLVVIFDKVRYKKTFVWALVSVIVLFVFLFTNQAIRALFESFFLMEYSISVNARLYGYEYYFKLFMNNPLWGIGFARSDVYYSLLHGNEGLAYVDDVGFVGQMGSLGLFSFVMYVPFILYLFRCFKQTKDRLVLLMLIYVLITSANLIVLDSQRIIIMPIILSITCYISKKSLQIERCENVNL